jgi:hypothetical protein
VIVRVTFEEEGPKWAIVKDVGEGSAASVVNVTFFVPYCANLTDYHWDRHLYFVITSLSRTDYDSLLIPIVTHY